MKDFKRIIPESNNIFIKDSGRSQIGFDGFVMDFLRDYNGIVIMDYNSIVIDFNTMEL